MRKACWHTLTRQQLYANHSFCRGRPALFQRGFPGFTQCEPGLAEFIYAGQTFAEFVKQSASLAVGVENSVKSIERGERPDLVLTRRGDRDRERHLAWPALCHCCYDWRQGFGD